MIYISIFLAKNRRDRGKSQSIWTDFKMETIVTTHPGRPLDAQVGATPAAAAEPAAHPAGAALRSPVAPDAATTNDHPVRTKARYATPACSARAGGAWIRWRACARVLIPAAPMKGARSPSPSSPSPSTAPTPIAAPCTTAVWRGRSACRRPPRHHHQHPRVCSGNPKPHDATQQAQARRRGVR
eukprot:COSAG01_NODE_10852_length_2068_cov_2.046724_2_plen_184_part_00